jgi:hypothetical protein
MPRARVLRALRGAQWLVNAYVIYRRNPGAWMLVLLGLLAAMVFSSLLPVIGPLVFGLLFPVFSVGIALAAQAVVRGAPIEPALFLSGFRASTSDLVSVGGIYLVGQLMIVGVMMAIGGADVARTLGAGAASGAAEAPVVATAAMALAGLVGLSLLLPLLLASWFAPLLIYFHGQKAVASLLASLGAALSNWRAFLTCFIGLLLVMILARLVVGILALVPAIGPLLAMIFLGALVAVLAPVGFISFYTSYADVFESDDDDSSGAAQTPDEAAAPRLSDMPGPDETAPAGQPSGQPPVPPAQP